MKIKQNSIDTVVYIIVCIITFGAAWISRIIISQAIRKSVEE